MNDVEIEDYLRASKNKISKRLGEYLADNGYPAQTMSKIQKEIWSWEVDSTYDLVAIISGESIRLKSCDKEKVEEFLNEYEKAYVVFNTFRIYKQAHDEKTAILSIVKDIKSLFD